MGLIGHRSGFAPAHDTTGLSRINEFFDLVIGDLHRVRQIVDVFYALLGCTENQAQVAQKTRHVPTQTLVLERDEHSAMCKRLSIHAAVVAVSVFLVIALFQGEGRVRRL